MQLRLRVILHSALPMFLVISCILMVWKGLCVWLDSPIPIVCVVSESMAPAFHRGDILVISNRQTDIHVGEIPVVWFPSSRLPMVHRAVKTWYTSSGEQELLTKGDNNMIDDVPIYPTGRTSVSRREVLGLVKLYVPFAGWAVIGFQDAFLAFKKPSIAHRIESCLRSMTG